MVEALAPVVTTLSPSSLTAGHSTTTLIITGSNFTPDAQVLWNGAPLPTQFVSANQVTVQLSADLLADGQTVGVAVRNQSPVAVISNAAVLAVVPLMEQRIYLPVVQR